VFQFRSSKRAEIAADISDLFLGGVELWQQKSDLNYMIFNVRVYGVPCRGILISERGYLVSMAWTRA
jgi:hypothetical protein